MFATRKLNHFPLRYCLRSFAGQSRPFPILPDTLDYSCPQIKSAEAVAEEHISKLHKLSDISRAGGGEKGIALHKKNKKMLIRDRISNLLDEGADNLELGLLTGLGMEYGDIPAGGLICTIGQIHGNYCMLVCNDGSVKGGAYFPVGVAKSLRFYELGIQLKLPQVLIVDCAGAFLPLQSELFPDRKHGGRAFYLEAVSGSLGNPQVSIISGSCTAGGAYAPAMCEDFIMVDKIGTMFLAGPPLVYAATGEKVSAEELGGATLHSTISGCCDYFASCEQDSFDMARDAIATVNITQEVHSDVSVEQPLYAINQLNALCGLDKLSKSLMYSIILRLVDGSRFREFKMGYGINLITGYALLDGHRVGVVANCGPITSQDALKGAHFIQNCEHRAIPILFLQNSGSKEEVEEFNGSLSITDVGITMKCRASMIAAVSCASVTKLVINVASCHGEDNYMMCGPSFQPTFKFMWPGTTVTHSLNPSTQSNTDQGEVKKQNKLSKFNFPTDSSWYFASRALTDGIIEPAETRKIMAQCLKICRQKERVQYNPKTFPVFRL